MFLEITLQIAESLPKNGSLPVSQLQPLLSKEKK